MASHNEKTYSLTNRAGDFNEYEEVISAFRELGVPHGTFNGEFFPLTEDEARFVAADSIEVADGWNIDLGSTVLHRGEKHVAPAMEVSYGDGGFASEDEARDFAGRVHDLLQPRIAGTGGFVNIHDDFVLDCFVVECCIPYGYVKSVADDLDGWKRHLADLIDIRADLAAGNGRRP